MHPHTGAQRQKQDASILLQHRLLGCFAARGRAGDDDLVRAAPSDIRQERSIMRHTESLGEVSITGLEDHMDNGHGRAIAGHWRGNNGATATEN